MKHCPCFLIRFLFWSGIILYCTCFGKKITFIFWIDKERNSCAHRTQTSSCWTILHIFFLNIHMFESILTYLLTPWCRVLSDQLTGLHLVKKFPAFHGTRRFITSFTSVRHLSLSWARPIQSTYPHPTSWRSILILVRKYELPKQSFSTYEYTWTVQNREKQNDYFNDSNSPKLHPKTKLPPHKIQKHVSNAMTSHLMLCGGINTTCRTSQTIVHWT